MTSSMGSVYGSGNLDFIPKMLMVNKSDNVEDDCFLEKEKEREIPKSHKIWATMSLYLRKPVRSR